MYAKIATLTRTLRGALGIVVSLMLKNSVGSRDRTSPFSPTRCWPTDATRPIAPSTRVCLFDNDTSSEVTLSDRALITCPIQILVPATAHRLLVPAQHVQVYAAANPRPAPTAPTGEGAGLGVGDKRARACRGRGEAPSPRPHAHLAAAPELCRQRKIAKMFGLA